MNKILIFLFIFLLNFGIELSFAENSKPNEFQTMNADDSTAYNIAETIKKKIRLGIINDLNLLPKNQIQLRNRIQKRINFFILTPPSDRWTLVYMKKNEETLIKLESIWVAVSTNNSYEQTIRKLNNVNISKLDKEFLFAENLYIRQILSRKRYELCFSKTKEMILIQNFREGYCKF